MAKINKLATLTMAVSLVVASIQPSIAAIEYDESNFGNPGTGRVIADTLVAKPLQLVNAIGSSVVFVISAPFAQHAGNLEQTKQKLVTEPWDAMRRCVGCTVAEDNYRTIMQQQQQPGSVSFTVTEPSRISIRSDGNVVVDDYTGSISQ